MPFRTFDVEEIRVVDVNEIGWPVRGAAGAEAGLGCNREYQDLRYLTWTEARRVLDLETALLSRLCAAKDPDEEYDLICEEQDDECGDHLFGLDLGVASTVVALSSAGCIPFTSCNGGFVGGRHFERHPLVAFYAKPRHLGGLVACAAVAGVGLQHSADGSLLVYCDDILKMQKFAKALIDSRHDFRAPPRGRQTQKRLKTNDSEQLELSDFPKG